MMEGNLINFLVILTFMGGLSLYLVIATAVGRAVYSRGTDLTEDGRLFLSIFCGALFPITIPVVIAILWVAVIINIPLTNMGKETTQSDSTKPQKEKEDYVRTKFKVGDLVTGKSGNPGNYQIFYPGCVCRVLEVGRKQVKLKLVDHIDKEANEEDFGRTDWFPQEEFTLIKPNRMIKKVVKKQKR